MSGSPAPPFRIRTTTDRELSAPKPWIVAGLLSAGEVSGLIAPPTTGKSALAVDLAATVALGEPWFGRETIQGAALYFAGERGQVTMRRLRAYETFHEVRGLNVGVVTDRLNLLHSAADARRVLDAVKAYEDLTSLPVRLITIDTARAAMPGGDENSARDMGSLAHHLALIRDGTPNAHLVVVHHTPKGRPGEASGSSALTAMLDAVMVVSVAKGERRSWRIAEANDLPVLPPPAFFRLQSVSIGRAEAPVVVPDEPRAATHELPSDHLPKDAALALEALRGLANGSQDVTIDEWRVGSYRAFNGRKPRDQAAQRQAFNGAKRKLSEAGLISIVGNTVSVRMREDA